MRLPGGPEGGQYHGFIAADSDQGWGTQNGSEIAGSPDLHAYVEPANPFLGDLPREPWSEEWGGTPLLEGETVSDHVYRSPGEMRPRANANGGANRVYAFQTRRTAGFAESPGNMAPPAAVYHRACPPLPPRNLGAGFTVPFPNAPPLRRPVPGPTNVVSQPGLNVAPQRPINTVTVSTLPPLSPAPAPTVPTTVTSMLPSQGLTLANQPATVAASPNPVMPPTPGSLWLPQTSYPYGSIITDSNGNLQMAVQAGVTGEIQPVWPLVPGTITTDGGYGTAVAWELYSGSNNNPGVQQQNALEQELLAQQQSGATTLAPAVASPDLSSIAGIEAWLQSNTIYAGAPNWAIVAGGAFVAWYFLLRKKH